MQRFDRTQHRRTPRGGRQNFASRDCMHPVENQIPAGNAGTHAFYLISGKEGTFELASASPTSFRKMKQSLPNLLCGTQFSEGSVSTSIPAGGESNAYGRLGSGCKFSFHSLRNARVKAATSAIVTATFGRACYQIFRPPLPRE